MSKAIICQSTRRSVIQGYSLRSAPLNQAVSHKLVANLVCVCRLPNQSWQDIEYDSTIRCFTQPCPSTTISRPRRKPVPPAIFSRIQDLHELALARNRSHRLPARCSCFLCGATSWRSITPVPQPSSGHSSWCTQSTLQRHRLSFSPTFSICPPDRPWRRSRTRG